MYKLCLEIYERYQLECLSITDQEQSNYRLKCLPFARFFYCKYLPEMQVSTKPTHIPEYSAFYSLRHASTYFKKCYISK